MPPAIPETTPACHPLQDSIFQFATSGCPSWAGQLLEQPCSSNLSLPLEQHGLFPDLLARRAGVDPAGRQLQGQSHWGCLLPAPTRPEGASSAPPGLAARPASVPFAAPLRQQWPVPGSQPMGMEPNFDELLQLVANGPAMVAMPGLSLLQHTRTGEAADGRVLQLVAGGSASPAANQPLPLSQADGVLEADERFADLCAAALDQPPLAMERRQQPGWAPHAALPASDAESWQGSDSCHHRSPAGEPFWSARPGVIKTYDEYLEQCPLGRESPGDTGSSARTLKEGSRQLAAAFPANHASLQPIGGCSPAVASTPPPGFSAGCTSSQQSSRKRKAQELSHGAPRLAPSTVQLDTRRCQPGPTWASPCGTATMDVSCQPTHQPERTAPPSLQPPYSSPSHIQLLPPGVLPSAGVHDDIIRAAHNAILADQQGGRNQRALALQQSSAAGMAQLRSRASSNSLPIDWSQYWLPNAAKGRACLAGGRPDVAAAGHSERPGRQPAARPPHAMSSQPLMY